MSEQEKIKCLQEHIQLLMDEISTIDLKSPRLSAEDYLLEKRRLQSLKNLRAIARNELNSLLHQYRFTLSGKITGSKGDVYERVVRTRVFSDIDCIIVSPATIKSSPEVSQPLIDIIKRDYSTYFLEGKFEIKRIKKIR
jgi:hypothetical protein